MATGEDTFFPHDIPSTHWWYRDEWGHVRQCQTLFEGACWQEQMYRHGETHVADHHFLGVRVSTIFLGLDHDIGHGAWGRFDDYRPVVWETMVFGGPFDGAQWRYRSWWAALKGHRKLLRMHLWWALAWPFKKLWEWMTTRR
jgi:hypothetical protein